MNMPFSNTLLISDMDGTLLDSRCSVSPENLNALNHYVDLGGLFTIATGRTEATLERYIRQLPVNLPVILYNGASIYDFSQKKVLWAKHLQPDTEYVIAHLMEKFPEMGVEIFGNDETYFVRENRFTDDHAAKDHLNPHYTSLSEIPKPWYKVLLAWEYDRLVDVEKYINKNPGDARAVFSELSFLEVLHRDASKGDALAELLKLKGLEKYHTIAVGDNMNDLEMIRNAKTGIAVENAFSGLKKAANLLCRHHDEHAIAQVVEWIEEKNLNSDNS